MVLADVISIDNTLNDHFQILRFSRIYGNILQ